MCPSVTSSFACPSRAAAATAAAAIAELAYDGALDDVVVLTGGNYIVGGGAGCDGARTGPGGEGGAAAGTDGAGAERWIDEV